MKAALEWLIQSDPEMDCSVTEEIFKLVKVLNDDSGWFPFHRTVLAHLGLCEAPPGLSPNLTINMTLIQWVWMLSPPEEAFSHMAPNTGLLQTPTHTHTPSWSRRSCLPLFTGTSWCLWSGMTGQSVWGWTPFPLRKDYWGVVSLFHLLNSLRWLWET